MLLIAAFSLPLAGAWLLQDRWRPSGSTHHGELLDPVLPISALAARTNDGRPLAEDYLQNGWTLAYLTSDACETNCREQLYKIRQIRLALGKDIDRAQTLLLLTASPDQAFIDWLAQQHASMTAAVTGADTLARLRQPFSGGDRHSVYLLDPLGNLVMRYGPEVAPKGIIADLKRLFKYSRIG